MKMISILFLALFSFGAQADVTKKEITFMIDQMVAAEVFSPAEAQAAKEKLNDMNESQLKELNAKGESIAKKMPERNIASSNNIEETKKIDFDGNDFKLIQEEVKKSLSSP